VIEGSKRGKKGQKKQKAKSFLFLLPFFASFASSRPS